MSLYVIPCRDLVAGSYVRAVRHARNNARQRIMLQQLDLFLLILLGKHIIITELQ